MQFLTEPLPYQQKAFDKLKDLRNGALFLTMGRGKTKVAIDIMAHKYLKGEIDRVLVVAPNLVHTQWVYEQLLTHCPVPYNAMAFRSTKTKAYQAQLLGFLRSQFDGLKVLAVHVDAFSHDTADWALDKFIVSGRTMIVLDEATRIKTPTTKRTKKLYMVRNWCGGPALILTGTALAKRVVDVWSLFYFMSPKIINQSFMSFKSEYTVLMQKTFEIKGGRKVTKIQEIDEFLWKRVKRLWEASHKSQNDIFSLAQTLNLAPDDVRFIVMTPKYTPYKNVDILKARVEPYTVFTDPNDDVKLPPKTYRTVEFKLEPVQKALLEQLKEFAVAMYQGTMMTLQSKVSIGSKALQICGGFFNPVIKGGQEDKSVTIGCKNAKLDYIMEMLDEIGDAQFLVFAVFTKEIVMLHEALSKHVSCAMLYGAVPDDERREVVAQFKEGSVQCIVCNPAVAGYGLNLQGAALQIWYSRDYNTENRLQAEGRSSRIGSDKTAVYIDLVYNVNFEKKVLQSNKEGRSLNDFFMSSNLNDILELI